MAIGQDNKSGVAGGVTAVTSTVGNGVGGLLGTVGSVTGAAARGSKSVRHVCLKLMLTVFGSWQHRDWRYRKHWKAARRCFGLPWKRS
jgi:hypothetical protein